VPSEPDQPLDPPPGPVLDRAQIARYIRSHVAAQVYDESGLPPHGTAIYTLSDPRELRLVRYVGQSRAPKRRFLQHLNTARVWLLADTPWWIKNPRLRPLSQWIRQLYLEEMRLPTMVICDWVDSTAAARLAERARICECLENQLQLLNVEAEHTAGQMQLL
jgi:hypothetical protein